MSKTPRIDRKVLRSPDEFVKKGNSLVEFLVIRRSPFLIVASLGAAAILLFYGNDYWNRRQLSAGWNDFHKAEKSDETAKWDQYKKVYNDHAKSRPGFIAATRIADHLFESARTEYFKDLAKSKPIASESAEWYEKARKFSGLLPTEKQLLGIDYGSALEMADRLDEALQNYRIASELPGDAKPYALLKLGGAYELKNELGKAEESYQKVTVDFPGTEFARIAKFNLRRMKSPHFPKSAS